MIPLGQLAKPDAGLKILTPWWDVLARYLTAAIVTIALTATALQAAKDNLICIPAVNCTEFLNNPSVVWNRTLPDNNLLRHVCNKGSPALTNSSRTIVLTTMSDRRQYDFVDSACFQRILQWFTAFFPFIIFGEAVLFLVIDNFWSKMPRTSSALNHFVALVMECYNTEATLSEILNVISKQAKQEADEETSPKNAAKFQTDKADKQPLVSKTNKDDKPAIKMNAKQQQKDLSDAIKVKTLYEKVEKFKNTYQAKNTLLRVYIIRAVLQSLVCVASLVLKILYYSSLSDTVDCHLNEVFITKYEYFECSRFIAPFYRAVVVIFAIPVVLCLLTSLYAIVWTVLNSGKTILKPEDAPEYVDKNTKITGDLSLLFFLLKEYDKLYSFRLAAFLSKANQEKIDKNLRNIYQK